MFAIEFEADIRNGLVKIPDEYRQLDNQHAKIVLMVKDNHTSQNQGTELDFTVMEIQAFSGQDGMDIQRIMRDEW
jgi:hypothetical protein